MEHDAAHAAELMVAVRDALRVEQHNE